MKKLTSLAVVVALASLAAVPALAGGAPALATAQSPKSNDAFAAHVSVKGPKAEMMGAAKALTIADYLAPEMQANGVARIQAEPKTTAAFGAIPKTRSALKQNGKKVLDGFAKAGFAPAK